MLTREELRAAVGVVVRGGCGPGCHLARLLKRFGFRPTPGCRCQRYAAEMDAQGCDWCQDNIDTIVGWLRDEAAKRGLPFLDVAGRILVRRAIKNARKSASSASTLTDP